MRTLDRTVVVLLRIFWVTAVLAVLLSGAAHGQSLVGRNANAAGPIPDGFYRGLPHYQDNEPSCKLNVLRPRNIICAWDGYNGADDLIGDAWVKLAFSNDNGRTWLTRYATGSNADPISSIATAADTLPIIGLGLEARAVCVLRPPSSMRRSETNSRHLVVVRRMRR